MDTYNYTCIYTSKDLQLFEYLYLYNIDIINE